MPGIEHTPETSTFALVRIGTLALAVPGPLLAEAVPGPIEVGPFPQAPWHVLGAFNHRGHAIPVIDIGTLVQPAAVDHPLRPVAYALVLQHSAGRFAIQVDEILGFVPATSGRITLLTPSATGVRPLFSELFTPANGVKPHVILDLDSLVASDGVRSAVFDSTNNKETTGESSQGTEPFTIFKAAGLQFALETKCLKRILQGIQSLDTPFSDGVLLGFLKQEGEDVPMLDFRSLMELDGAGTPAAEPMFLIVQGHERAIGLRVDGVSGMPWLKRAEFKVLDESGVPRPECYRGTTVGSEGEPILVLETEHFLKHAALLKGAGIQDKATAPLGEVRGKHRSVVEDTVRHFLIFRAGGGRLACELSDLDSVIRVPDDFSEASTPGQELLGFCTHHGETVKLLSLARLLGKADSRAAVGASALVIRSADGLSGFVVDAVDFLQHGQRQELPGSRDNGLVPAFTHSVRVTTGETDFAACVMPLKAFAQRLAGLRR